MCFYLISVIIRSHLIRRPHRAALRARSLLCPPRRSACIFLHEAHKATPFIPRTLVDSSSPRASPSRLDKIVRISSPRPSRVFNSRQHKHIRLCLSRVERRTSRPLRRSPSLGHVHCSPLASGEHFIPFSIVQSLIYPTQTRTQADKGANLSF